MTYQRSTELGLYVCLSDATFERAHRLGTPLLQFTTQRTANYSRLDHRKKAAFSATFKKSRYTPSGLPFRSCDSRMHRSQPDLSVKLGASWFVLKKGTLNETYIHPYIQPHLWFSFFNVNFILFHYYMDGFLFPIKLHLTLAGL